MTTTAQAPSDNWEADPAVMAPPSLNAGGRAASRSRVVSGRTPSSSSMRTSPPRPDTVTGTISSASRPALIAAADLACDSAANASWSCRGIPKRAWSRSVAAPIEIPSNPQISASLSSASMSTAAP